MNTIDKLRSRLEKYPEVSYDYDDNSLTVYAANTEGFQVKIISDDQGYSVYFEKWHEEFYEEEEALNCFAFGLSNSCRLKVYSKGDFPYKWAVEFKENDTWRVDSITGALIYPFWRRSKIQFLQNNLIQD